MSKREILKDALAARVEEVGQYQLNIDNYRLAIPRAEGDPDLTDFVISLRELLRSSIIEQKKAQIMLDVIQSQLEVEDDSTI